MFELLKALIRDGYSISFNISNPGLPADTVRLVLSKRNANGTTTDYHHNIEDWSALSEAELCAEIEAEKR